MKKVLLLLIVLSSCTPVYVPNLRNSPMLRKAGEVQGSLHIGNGIEGQAAAALTDNIAIIADYAYINRTRFNEDDFIRHKLYEAGLGYYTNEEETFFEIFAGYGKGEGSSSGSFLGLQGAIGRYERYFIQPAIGMNKSEIHFSFVPRISVVDFKEFQYGATVETVDEKPKVFIEPAFMIRANSMKNHLFFTFQAGLSARMSNNIYFDRRNFQTGMGIGFRLGGIKEAVPSRQ